MKLFLVILLLTLLSACTSGEEKAHAICLDKGGVKGYQERWGFPVVVCNNGVKEIIE